MGRRDGDEALDRAPASPATTRGVLLSRVAGAGRATRASCLDVARFESQLLTRRDSAAITKRHLASSKAHRETFYAGSSAENVSKVSSRLISPY